MLEHFSIRTVPERLIMLLRLIGVFNELRYKLVELWRELTAAGVHTNPSNKAFVLQPAVSSSDTE
jgi:hypothetical protein